MDQYLYDCTDYRQEDLKNNINWTEIVIQLDLNIRS